MASDPALTTANFLRLYGGEVLAAFDHEIMIADKLQKRNISNGRSASFPLFGVEEAKLHTSGADLFGSTYDSDVTEANKEIIIDHEIIAKQFTATIDESMAAYDVRSVMAEKSGKALAVALDRWALSVMAKSAVDAGNTYTDGGAFASITATMVKNGISDAALAFDNRKVPQEDRYMLVRPKEYYKLLDDNDVVSSDYGRGGDRASGKMVALDYLGFRILPSTVMSEFADTTAAEQVAASGPLYFGGQTQRTVSSSDLQLTFGVAFQKHAAGLLSLNDIAIDVDRIPERRGHLITAGQMIGVGELQSDATHRLKTTT